LVREDLRENDRGRISSLVETSKRNVAVCEGVGDRVF